VYSPKQASRLITTELDGLVVVSDKAEERCVKVLKTFCTNIYTVWFFKSRLCVCVGGGLNSLKNSAMVSFFWLNFSFCYIMPRGSLKAPSCLHAVTVETEGGASRQYSYNTVAVETGRRTVRFLQR
jgi:hypothetical protein